VNGFQATPDKNSLMMAEQLPVLNCTVFANAGWEIILKSV
jgi:hypothetical protein